jgi:hypothetical protein
VITLAKRGRGFVAIVCLVVAVAIAMAPIASKADSAVGLLVPLPGLFAAVVSRPLPAPELPRIRPTLDSSPLPLRAPPVR